MTLRAKIEALVDAKAFQNTIATIIVLNAVVMAIDTYGAMGRIVPVANASEIIENAFLSVFLVEIALRFFAKGLRFFRDPWSIFDTLVTLPALAFQGLSIARVLRVIRLLRMISVFRSFRGLTTAMARSLADAASLVGIMVLITFISSAICVQLFGHASPEQFGNVGAAMFTLFRAFAFFEALSIASSLPGDKTLATAFLTAFYALMVFALSNFFIAIATFYMVSVMAERQAEKNAEGDGEAKPSETEVLRRDIGQIKELLAARFPGKFAGTGSVASDGPGGATVLEKRIPG